MEFHAIQQALKESGIDGWLFYDFHSRDQIGIKILGLEGIGFTSRRWFYYIPAVGEPKKLVHSIERSKLDSLPGEKLIYLPWQQQHQLLRKMLGKAKKVAMQYSPNNAIPYVSIVDGGTIDLIRSFGIEVVSSADLVGRFEAHLSPEDYKTHLEAGRVMEAVKDATFSEIGRRILAGERPLEIEIQAFMHQKMREGDMVWEDGPIVAVNEHAADPHFEPKVENSVPMKKDDLVLLDLWAKKNSPRSIYYDITWMGYIGTDVPERFASVFHVARNARNACVAFLKERFAQSKPVHGWEVDNISRQMITAAGYGDYFIHRTGHNIGTEVHGNGVNIDNLETKDERLILPGTCFSIEPGIYLVHEKFGIRTEINVFVTDEGEVQVTGPSQEEIVPILK